ncbi:MAG: cob(I)yrinic acid a,c-diamide adenosyltransferase [Candidatus Manganitrophaceae bacterium]|nr:MAG: cob(I)yrinic acid a,c-diamide adenosyltransferase [Candidatus Manganitrophaceae bacterium]
MPAKGLIMINTGNGKGKTTAALGTAFRALGYGWKILVIQFIKGNWHYGELDSAKKFGDFFQILPMGEGFTWDTKNPERDWQKAQEAWEFGVKEALTGNYQMIIFDEINYVIRYNYLEVEKVVAFLKTKPSALHVFLTGRDAHEQLIEIADLVTEMREIKHPFKKGIKAQKGIEF